MQNNPVSGTDWLGNYFTWGQCGTDESIKAAYMTMRKKTEERKGKAFSEILNTIISNGIEGSEKKLGELSALVSAFGRQESQWDEMENSCVEFNVTTDMPSDSKASGDTYWENSNTSSPGRIKMNLGTHFADMETMAHEFDHGYGYLVGNQIPVFAGLYDATDELSAYNAGFLIGGNDAKARDVIKGKFDLKWFYNDGPGHDNYPYLRPEGKRQNLSLNTLASVYLSANSENDAISVEIKRNPSNINLTIKQVLDNWNSRRKQDGFSQNIYGSMMENRK